MSGVTLRAMLPMLVFMAGGLLLAGCSLLGGGPKPVKADWQSLAFAAASDANANSALAVDVVLVKDKAVLETLAAMSASRYFAAKADLQRTYPDALTVLAVEITPGQSIRIERKRFGAERVWGALAFANYAAPGEHRLRLPLDANACLLQLNAQEFVVTDSKTGPAR
jgi:type VI secretion system protein